MISAVRSYFPFSITSRTERASPPSYAFSDLGTHADGTPLLPVALTDAGELGVSARDPDNPGLLRGYLLRGAEQEPIGLACGQSPLGCMSSDGKLAGTTGQEVRLLRAWASHLGAFGEKNWPGAISNARGVNARGQIAGHVLFDAGEFMLSRAFVAAPTGQFKFLAPPLGGTATARAINDDGDVVVNSTPLGAGPEDTRAWCLRENCYTSLSSLGGGRTFANALTPAGRIVGWSLRSAKTRHAFLWENGQIIDLGTCDNHSSEALAANDDRTVVGRTIARDGTPRAFRWTAADGLQPLEQLAELPRGWVLREAVAINRHGVIAGVGLRRGTLRGFLLRPTATSNE